MKRRVSFLSKIKCWKKNRLSKWFPIKGTHCTVVVQHTVMWTNERVPIRNWRRGLFCRFLPLDRMFSGVFFWHVDTPIYRDLIWQPSELGPHGEKRGGEGWVLLSLFIPSASKPPLPFPGCSQVQQKRQGLKRRFIEFVSTPLWASGLKPVNRIIIIIVQMLKFSVNGIVGNVWFLCNTDLKYRLLASTKLNLANFCVRKLNLHFVAICPTCSYLQECPTVQISKSPRHAAWWIFTGMKIRSPAHLFYWKHHQRMTSVSQREKCWQSPKNAATGGVLLKYPASVQ